MAGATQARGAGRGGAGERGGGQGGGPNAGQEEGEGEGEGGWGLPGRGRLAGGSPAASLGRAIKL